MEAALGFHLVAQVDDFVGEAGLQASVFGKQGRDRGHVVGRDQVAGLVVVGHGDMVAV